MQALLDHFTYNLHAHTDIVCISYAKYQAAELHRVFYVTGPCNAIEAKRIKNHMAR